MTKLEKQIRAAEKKVTSLVKSKKWQEEVKKTDLQVMRTLEQLRQKSRVDPKLLDEPATL